ncbi:MAG: aminotransferase class III-fold pyridoxal phosphate-dependent enzyme [Bacteroides sp.]|nr:MAG: aminotransferase class III-fold pyridoxal phosphate-dependent enzyme [Bacteroides sp.]
MQIFDVYPKVPIQLVNADKYYVFDKNDNKYLDFYGGNAVISIGHKHPHYIKSIYKTLKSISYYSNLIEIEQQNELSNKLATLSNCIDYNLFLVNSGAEANENALKIASFYNGRKKIISFKKSFHGRTSGALSVTDNLNFQSNFNKNNNVIFLPINDKESLYKNCDESISAIIIEGIQGMGGINEIDSSFMQAIRKICDKYNIIMIVDEVQSGYGRTGNFFAYQLHNIKPDIISIAKGMGNGFPIGGVIISNKIKPIMGYLGTTFGGSYLACSAAIAVLDIIKKENLINNAKKIGLYFTNQAKSIKIIDNIKGKGLMIGLCFKNYDIKYIHNTLLMKYKIFTGLSGDHKTLRILPPLNITYKEVDYFLNILDQKL